LIKITLIEINKKNISTLVNFPLADLIKKKKLLTE